MLYISRYRGIPSIVWVGNMLTWYAVKSGSILREGIHSDSDDHYIGGPVSLDPQWHVKESWRP